MKSKKLTLLLFLVFSIIPTQKIFAEVSNVGFIPASIWYSKDPFVEGDKIKIYTVVYNPDERELSGTVIFFDNTTLLGTKDVKIPAKSVKDVSIDWIVGIGDHSIFAKIENAKFLISSGKYEEVYLAENKTAESKRSVSKKIVSDLPNNIIDSISNTIPVSTIEKTVKDNTPTFVTNTIDTTTNTLEGIRSSTSISLENKKGEVQKEIDLLNKKTISESENNNKKVVEKLKNTDNQNVVLKPFKYAELFLLTIFSFIFKQKVIFYGLLIVIFLLLIRYLWRLIF